MSSVCEEQHKFQLPHPSHQLLSLKSSLRDIDIPPRKLLTRRTPAASRDAAGEVFSDDTLLHHNKYLPRNKPTDYSDDGDDSSGEDPYSSDHFRIYEFKVRRCTRSRSHDWTDCPFAHPGEKARRRDPRRYHYSGTVCPEYRRDGACRRGEACEFSHGVFECWLHPARYRTEACKDGRSCKRKVCFFAHTPRQLRILPLDLNSHLPQNDAVSCCNKSKTKFRTLNPNSNNSIPNSSHCCLFCHCCCNNNSCASNSNCSPTSTLFGVSHFNSSSPPMSPNSPAASIGGVNRRRGGGGLNVSYKDVLTEIMCSIEGLNFGGDASSPSSKAQQSNNNAVPNWLHDVCSEDRKQNFNILSPTAPPSFSVSGKLFGEDGEESDRVAVVDDVSRSSCGTPDLGWVNDLLM